MKKTPFSDTVSRSRKIRKIYHRLEVKHHGSQWTLEEDALAFLTDAGLVGRLTMAHQGRWPLDEDKAKELGHKLGECIWWLIVLAERLEIGAENALDVFLTKTEQKLKAPLQTNWLQTKKSRAKTNTYAAAGSATKKRPH